MNEIEHKYIKTNGVKLHVAEINGNGSNSNVVVLFCHGFPEIWYSWRHQMIAVAKAGYRAISIDYRGFGLSDKPPVPENTTVSDLITDLYSLLDVLAISKVFLVAKDIGARIAYLFTLFHPERVSGIVTLGIPFLPPKLPPTTEFLPEGFYVSRWMEPGRAEADFARFDLKTIVRNIYILFSGSEIPIARENQEIMDLVDTTSSSSKMCQLPSWITEDEFATYAALYEISGFQTGIQVTYRAMNEEFQVPEVKVNAPALLIMGEKDYYLKFPGMDDYIRNEGSKQFVPKFETVYIPEGSHFVQEQFPDQVNQLIVNFIKNNT